MLHRIHLEDTVIDPRTEDWEAYYRATAGRNPSPWFIEAVDYIDANHGQGRLAVDLGCGNGVESKALLDRGWRVLAIDSEPSAIEVTRARAAGDEADRLTTLVSRFAGVDLPEVDLVFAQLSLPFCPVEVFDGLWQQIRGAIRPGGHFVGQFLGPDDDWAAACLVHSIDDVENLATGWEIELLREQRHEGVGGARRDPKFWHLISLIARRPED